MLKTVILSPYCKYASGTMEQTSDAHSIKLRLNLDCRDCNEDDIIRLYALSTAHAAMQPYLVQSFEGNFLSPLESVIYESDIFSLGYKLWEIDTYVITKFTKDTETAVAAAFFGLEWSASRFLKDKGEITDVDSDSPLKRAKQILDNRKNTNQKENSDFFAKEFSRNVSNHVKATVNGIENYHWYKIKHNTTISTLSAVKHTLSGKYALMAINDCGYYLAGINKNDNHHIAIAIAANQNICPMPQLSDCVSYIDGFHIAGIYLGDDGQYFEKYLQNQK